MRLLPVFSVAAVLSTAACTNDLWRPIDAHPNQAEPMPAASTTTYSVAVGADTGVQRGEQVGYSVTALAPRTYRLVWTGDTAKTGSASHEFAGSVWTTGHFVNVTPGCNDGSCTLEDQDYVSGVTKVADGAGGGERIDWDTFASVGFDGLDVETDGAPIYLDVRVDGARHAELAYLPTNGGKDVTPQTAPFGVVAQ
jgi:hypothetical protein